MPMKFVVGLGNPGKRYEGTPHNVGFEVIGRLLRSAEFATSGATFTKRFKAEYLDGMLGEERVYLVRPLTYMNLSGPAVRSLLGYFRGEGEDLLVVHDDLDLPLGRLRFRPGGSSGGHLGVASVAEALGGGEFARLKIGIGRGEVVVDGEERRPGAVDHVLGRFGRQVREDVDRVLDRAAEAVGVWVEDGLECGQQLYNGV